MSREIQANQEAWSKLAEESRIEGPFFARIAVKPSPEGVVLKRRWTRWLTVLILLGFSGLMYLGAYFLFELSVARFFFFLIVFGLATVAALLCQEIIRAVKKITLNHWNDTVNIRYGLIPFTRSVTVSANECSTRLYCCVSAMARRTIKSGFTILSLLSDKSPNQEFILAAASRKSRLLPAFERLREFLPKGGTDETIQEVELPNGQVIKVSTEALTGGGKAEDTVRTFRILSTDSAAFSRKWRHVFLGFGFAGGILAAVTAWIYGDDNEEGTSVGKIILIIFVLILSLLGAIFGATLGIYWWRTRHIIADKANDTLSCRASARRWYTGRRLCTLSEIVAVQVCLIVATISSGESWKEAFVYEINVILQGPDAERINITTGQDDQQIRGDAADFAEFIGVPVVDHS